VERGLSGRAAGRGRAW